MQRTLARLLVALCTAAAAAAQMLPIVNTRITGTAEVKSGGTIQVESGATLQVESGATVDFDQPLPLGGGGTGAALVDPNVDRIIFWDDSAGVVAWLEIGSGLSVSGTTLAATGFVNPMTTAGDLIIGGSSGAAQRLAVGTEGQALLVVGGAPAWGNVLTNPMTTAGDLIVGGTAGAAQRLALGTDGQVLKVVGGALVWGSDATGSGSLPGTPSAGDVAYYNGTDWVSLAIGSAGEVLEVNAGATAPEWNPAPSIGTHTIFVPAGAMLPSTTNGCAPLATVEISTGQPELVTLDFDSSVDESAQFSVAMPKSWDLGTVTVEFLWSHAAAATNFAVVWAAEAVAVGDDDAVAATYGTVQTVTDSGGTTDDLYISAATPAITVGGTPAQGDMVFVRVYRDADNAADTLATDARLHGVRIRYGTSAANDD